MGSFAPVEPFRRFSRLKCVARQTKERLLRDQANLTRALRDYRSGKTPALPELELAAFVDGIERRLGAIEEELRDIDAI